MKLDTVLRGLADVGREEICRDFTPDSCIASTKIVIRVCHHFGFHAVPFGVRLVLGNRAFTEKVKENDGLIPTMSEAITAGWFLKTGAWSVGIGYTRDAMFPSNKWPGHLVAILPERGVLIDASAEQGNRPEKGIRVPGVLIFSEMRRDFMEGSVILRAELNGCMIEYRPYQDDTFRRAPDWTETARTKKASKRIIEYIDRLR